MKNKPTIDIILPILSGLLASGHYTHEATESDDCGVLTIDNGEDWKEAFPRRYSTTAVDHAINIAQELVTQIKLDEQP